MNILDRLTRFLNFRFNRRLKRAIARLQILTKQNIEQMDWYAATFSQGYTTFLNDYCISRDSALDFVIAEVSMVLLSYGLPVECYDRSSRLMQWKAVKASLQTIVHESERLNAINRIELLRIISIELRFGK